MPLARSAKRILIRHWQDKQEDWAPRTGSRESFRGLASAAQEVGAHNPGNPPRPLPEGAEWTIRSPRARHPLRLRGPENHLWIHCLPLVHFPFTLPARKIQSTLRLHHSPCRRKSLRAQELAIIRGRAN